MASTSPFNDGAVPGKSRVSSLPYRVLHMTMDRSDLTFPPGWFEYRLHAHVAGSPHEG